MVSFEQFVESSAPRLVRTARLLLGDRAEAEDLAQETLIVVHQHWNRIRDARALDSYAYTVLMRLARRHRRRGWFTHERVVPDVSALTDVAGREMPKTEWGVGRALAMLPARQRETLVLRYYLDLPVADTARILRCSEGTVKSQTSDGLRAMRTMLVEDLSLHGKDDHGS